VAWDSQKAALKLGDCRAAFGWVAQAALRDTPAPLLDEAAQFGPAFGRPSVNDTGQLSSKG
jgi:hypothetical protein